ncbi:MAG: hypothetical protein HQK74_09855, partial [Desulfamplus sp.]|nr:hypothetical protein [Desulfamplus sp.]
PFKDHHHHSSNHSNKGEEASAHDTHEQAIKEAPLGMLIPFMAVSILLVVLGLYSGQIVNNIINFAIPSSIL